MALKLYRRRRKGRNGGHPEDARTGQFEEGRRGWKRCACIIGVAGIPCKKFNRRQTGETDWAREPLRMLAKGQLSRPLPSFSGRA
jgi:hypothetical protein